jgi:hypothetical protein
MFAKVSPLGGVANEMGLVVDPVGVEDVKSTIARVIIGNRLNLHVLPEDREVILSGGW